MNHDGVEKVGTISAQRVRQNAGQAGFTAICLLFFGFGYFSPPTATGLFSTGDALFNYTLRGGGLVMACVALACLVGKPAALMVDAVVSVVIGGLLAVSAAMMIFGGGLTLSQAFYLVIAGTFISAGVRNGRSFQAMTRKGP